MNRPTQPSPDLLGIPTELRLQIFGLIYLSTTSEILRGYTRSPEKIEEYDRDSDDDDAGGIQISFRTSAKQSLSPLPATPQAILSMKLVCRLFHDEIKDEDWHGKVLYDFPSTVAFIDVLSQWPQAQIESLRHVRVDDSPLPLYPHDDFSCYHVSDFDAALPMFPGLRLETLHVGSLWLNADGSPIDGWCGIATAGAVRRLLFTTGWKKLYYRTGILGLTPRQQRDIAKQAAAEREEGFEYEYGRVRPNLNHVHGTESDGEEEEVKEWYRNHTEEGEMDDYPAVEDFQIAMWARRGEGAEYVQDGKAISPMIKDLKEKIGWLELRKSDQWLVDDGLDNPTSHL